MAFKEHFIRRETFQEEEDVDPPEDEMNLEHQLMSFRQQWKEELASTTDKVASGQQCMKEVVASTADKWASSHQSRMDLDNATDKAASGHQWGRAHDDKADSGQQWLKKELASATDKAASGQQWQVEELASTMDKVVVMQERGSDLTSGSPPPDEHASTRASMGVSEKQQQASVAEEKVPGGKKEKEDAVINGENVEAKAKELFMQGVNAERHGNLTEAICKYRHAIQLVPDVESRITDYTVNRPKKEEADDVIQDGYEDNGDSDSDAEDDCMDELVSELRALTTNDIKSHCQPKFPQSSTHVSSLPIELLLYIFRWVVSSDLDLRSLDLLSFVCRGFYVCARDPSLWHRACLGIWGRNCCMTTKYSTWRQMFLERPHPNFNGVYITKNTYFKQGEPGMDGIYRPWHMVEYYRYVRMFPDGVILMYTAPDEPKAVVSKLQNQTTSLSGILVGQFRIVDDMITAILHRENTKDYECSVNRYIRYKRNKNVKVDTNYTFHLEFNIRSAGHRPNCKLEWHSYRCHTHHRPTGNTSVSDFEVERFMPIIFSRVKSYTTTSVNPL